MSVSPDLISMLLPQLFQQQQGATPAQGQLDPTQMAAEMMQQGKQVTGEQMTRGRGALDESKRLVGEQERTPIPKMGWGDPGPGRRLGDPGYQEPQGGFLHNLGRSLIALAGATVPGRAIQAAQYGPGLRAYEAETGARAKEISELQSQAKTEFEPVAATTRAGPQYMTGAARMTAAEAAMKRADAYVEQVVPNQIRVSLAKIDLARAALDEKVRNDMVKELQAKIDEVGRNYRAENRDATSEEVARVLAGSHEAIASLISARNPSLWNQIKNMLGVEVPTLPGDAQPQLGATPKKPPARPEGVPADAKWDEKTRQWYK